MKRVKRGYADEELWKLIGRTAVETRKTKQEVSTDLARFLKNRENDFNRYFGIKNRREDKKFDFSF